MKRWFAAALMASALATASTAAAVDFSFTGTFAPDDDVAFSDFAIGATTLVTLRSYSYAGGVNAAGATIAAGGFDPSLFIYNLGTGARIAGNADGGCTVVPADPVTGQCWDAFFQALLPAGSYRVAITDWDVSAPINLAGAFSQSATGFVDFTGATRDGHWAFDVITVPEPVGWALMIAGFGLAGAALRRRRGAMPSRP